MIPGVHYPDGERYMVEENKKCPHCGYKHAGDISCYEVCSNCHKPMTEYAKKIFEEKIKK